MKRHKRQTTALLKRNILNSFILSLTYSHIYHQVSLLFANASNHGYGERLTLFFLTSEMRSLVDDTPSLKKRHLLISSFTQHMLHLQDVSRMLTQFHASGTQAEDAQQNRSGNGHGQHVVGKRRLVRKRTISVLGIEIKMDHKPMS